MKKDEFKPYIPADKITPEFTVTSVIMGVLLAIIFGAANAYLGLRVGMTVSASIPAAVISMGIIRVILRKDSILENNMVQTIGSAGESLAAGAIFTMPALFLWAEEGLCDKPSLVEITLIALCGGVLGVSGLYQAGFFGVMMFGLPGAALAMYRCARKENKKKVGAILFSAALASFFTGVTEPLEFAFMFVAPTLYFIHALLTGLMLFIAATFKWMAGFGFSAGLIDYVLSFKSPFANNILFLIPLGILCGLIYYIVFRVLITRYNIMTPGREENEVKKVEKVENNFDEIAIQLFEALGGKKNIISVDHCITRLRVEVKDISLIDKQTLSKMNFSHIVESSEHEIQIIIGTEVQFIAEILNEILM